VGTLQGAVDPGRRTLECLGCLACREAEHGALARRQVLERRYEGEFDALALFVAGLRTGDPVLDAELRVEIGLHPDRFEERRGEAVVGVGRRAVVDR
jgi:hypothetical protein